MVYVLLKQFFVIIIIFSDQDYGIMSHNEAINIKSHLGSLNIK